MNFVKLDEVENQKPECILTNSYYQIPELILRYFYAKTHVDSGCENFCPGPEIQIKICT